MIILNTWWVPNNLIRRKAGVPMEEWEEDLTDDDDWEDEDWDEEEEDEW